MPNHHSQVTVGRLLKTGESYLLRNGHRIWSEKAFKKRFKVGDLICGGASVVGRISAIGRKRFLFVVTRGHPDYIHERVGMISTPTGWGKPGERRL
jgi:hypothetical protein